jgi:predicted DNA binding CopG/RHH family protein
MNDAKLNMKIPSELMEKVKKEADKKCISVASLVRMVLAEYVRDKKGE